MLKAHDLTIGYRSNAIVEGISFEVPSGQCVLLEGPNGSGKSTLLKTIAGLQKPIAGSVESDSVRLVPSRVDRVKGFTVREFVATSQYGYPADATAVDRAIDKVGMATFANRDISTLSDGEFQKVCIATALTRPCGAILLDEPTAFLDAEGRIAVLEMLRDLSRDLGIVVMYSSHDLHDAEPLSDRIFCLKGGSFTEKR